MYWSLKHISQGFLFQGFLQLRDQETMPTILKRVFVVLLLMVQKSHSQAPGNVL